VSLRLIYTLLTPINTVDRETERFRILIVGNANAGKTTILEKVCHATGREPEFFNAEGEKVGAVLLVYVGFGFIAVFFLFVLDRL
jgi:hypothetical protein